MSEEITDPDIMVFTSELNCDMNTECEGIDFISENLIITCRISFYYFFS